jgi:predicted secreted protein
MIRDASDGVYVDNEFERNISQIYLSGNCRRLLAIMKKKNKIEGRFDVASTCNIF